MQITVVYYQADGREAGRETRDEKLATAEAYVEDAVALGQHSAIELLDSEGRLLFRRPRTVSPSTPPRQS